MPGLSEVALVVEHSEELTDVENDVRGWSGFSVEVDFRVEELKDLEHQVAKLECIILI